MKDYACYCERCTRRTEEMYRLPFHCGNCGADWIGQMRKGDKPPLLPECPTCGVGSWSTTRGKAYEVVQP